MLDSLGADIMVISELQPTFLPPHGWSLALRSEHSPRVLGVLARPGWTLAEVEHDPGLPWLLPLDVRGPGGEHLTLLALWTVAEKGRPHYPQQTHQAIAAWEAARSQAGQPAWERTVLAGDFNASLQSTNAPGHRKTLAQLHERGLVSAYHHAHACEHGQEPVGTLRWVGRGRIVMGFHCDFIFVSLDLADGLHGAAGTFDEWCGPGLSDHVPVTATVRIPATAPAPAISNPPPDTRPSSCIGSPATCQSLSPRLVQAPPKT